jgi:hypothetical protein
MYSIHVSVTSIIHPGTRLQRGPFHGTGTRLFGAYAARFLVATWSENLREGRRPANRDDDD